MINEDRRILKGRFSEDEYYELVREFLTENRSVPMVYVIEKDDQGVFMDPNMGQVISPDVSGWDQTDYEQFFRRMGINHIVVRDPVGSVPVGEYSRQGFLRKLRPIRRGKTFKVVPGQPIGGPPRTEALSLQNALLDNDWPKVV